MIQISRKHGQQIVLLLISLSHSVRAFEYLRSPLALDNILNITISETGSEVFSTPGIITIPLIPHHVQRRRHLELARELERQNREAGYPARRRYRSLQDATSTAESEHFTAQQVAALFQGYGTHYADLWCGTPPQRQTVIVDTGSGVTAFPCAECKDCGVPDYHIDPLYNEVASSTFRKLGCDECLRGSCSGSACTIGQAYQEGSSWNAYEAIDSCYVGGVHAKAVDTPSANDKDDMNPFDAKLFAFDMKFGCQTRLTGLFKTQLADGIMGMDVAAPSYWWQMYDAKRIGHKSFSLCFSRKEDADPSGTEAGAMSFGGTDVRLHKSDMVYSATQSSGDSGFYVVHVKKVWLRAPGGGSSALSTDPSLKHTIVKLSEDDLNSGRVIVDSGTTDTYFSKRFGVAFQAAWEEVMGQKYSHDPLDVTAEELMRTQPTILFQLNGDVDLNKGIKERSSNPDAFSGLANALDVDNPYDVVLAIPPSHYYEYDDEVKKYVARFYVDDSSGGVLGANAMMGHDVYFDIERNRIGWAESECDYSTMVSKYMNGEDFAPHVDKKSEDEGSENTGNGEEENGGDVVDSKASTATNDYGGAAPEGFCSGLSCQVIVAILIIGSVLFVAWRIVRKPVGPNYDLAEGTELELTTKNSYDDDFVNGSPSLKYRNGTTAPSRVLD